MKPFQVQPTPNPDSLKFTATRARFIEDGMLTFASAAEAETHPLGQALFQIDGVENVLVLPPFVTVTKRPEANWKTIQPAIEQVLTEHLERR